MHTEVRIRSFGQGYSSLYRYHGRLYRSIVLGGMGSQWWSRWKTRRLLACIEATRRLGG
jgi:hypothetical protein